MWWLYIVIGAVCLALGVFIGIAYRKKKAKDAEERIKNVEAEVSKIKEDGIRMGAVFLLHYIFRC